MRLHVPLCFLALVLIESTVLGESGRPAPLGIRIVRLQGREEAAECLPHNNRMNCKQDTSLLHQTVTWYALYMRQTANGSVCAVSAKRSGTFGLHFKCD